MEVSESLLQLRKLHRDLLDAFDKLNSFLESVQKVRDVFSNLPDAHTMLKEQGYTDISMADINAAHFEIFLHKTELKGILQLAPVYLKIFHENYPELMIDAE